MAIGIFVLCVNDYEGGVRGGSGGAGHADEVAERFGLGHYQADGGYWKIAKERG